MIAHAKQAMVYILIVATTFVGTWLLFGREMEAGAVSVPMTQAAEPAPLIFEASDRTCVYIAGQLECFCSCADVRASCDAPLFIQTEPQGITAPMVGSGTGDGLAGTTRTVEVNGTEDKLASIIRTVEVTETETISVKSATMPVVPPRLDSDSSHDRDEKPKCNQGVGNGPEGCDPGNSNHNQPSNDEDGGTPGSPGRQGGSKPDGDNDRPARPDKDD